MDADAFYKLGGPDVGVVLMYGPMP